MAGGVGSPHQQASYDESKREGFFEPGKEEPGGVGGEEVIQGGEVGGVEMEGGHYAPEGIFFKKQFLRN